MRINQFGIITTGRLHPQQRRGGILAAVAQAIACWRRSGYAPLCVVLLVWLLLFLLAIALVSAEQW